MLLELSNLFCDYLVEQTLLTKIMYLPSNILTVMCDLVFSQNNQNLVYFEHDISCLNGHNSMKFAVKHVNISLQELNL